MKSGQSKDTLLSAARSGETRVRTRDMPVSLTDAVLQNTEGERPASRTTRRASTSSRTSNLSTSPPVDAVQRGASTRRRSENGRDVNGAQRSLANGDANGIGAAGVRRSDAAPDVRTRLPSAADSTRRPSTSETTRRSSVSEVPRRASPTEAPRRASPTETQRRPSVNGAAKPASKRSAAAAPVVEDDEEDDDDDDVFYDASANTGSSAREPSREPSRAASKPRAAAAAVPVERSSNRDAPAERRRERGAADAKPSRERGAEETKAAAPRRSAQERANMSASKAVVGPPPKNKQVESVTDLHHEQAKGRAERMAKLKTSDVQTSTEELYDDLNTARRAMHLFMNSRMNEAYLRVTDKSECRLYHAVAFALLSTIKAMMTFEQDDLATAISHCKDALHIASVLRKKSSMISSFGRFVRGAGPSVTWVATMTPLQQHAELVTAECMLLKAMLSILHSGDLLAVLSEALHLRSAYCMYYSLLKFVEWEEQHGAGTSGATHSDNDFRSGVYLGTGCISLILGLLPSKVLKIMEVFGYGGDVHKGLELLARAGRWSDAPEELEPGETVETEGVRRVICDMAMLVYHLVISTFIPVPAVNIPYAEKVLNHHLARYPHGVFFLYFHGRLYSTQGLSRDAIECFEEARDVQEEYVQLKHICFWDMALCTMSLGAWKETARDFAVLAEENNWSKAVYTYAGAAALYQSGDAASRERASEMFAHVPSLTQKIAGKSIPLEKFVARKARKMIDQGYLTLPCMEFAYVCHCYTTASYRSLSQVLLPLAEKALAENEGVPDHGDDVCLAHFLRGVILRNMAYPEAHVHDEGTKRLPTKQLEREAEASLQYVASRGAELTYDHYLAYFAHYELGRLYLSAGRIDEARHMLEVVMSGKNLGDHGRKGKYSMQNMAVLRSNGALEMLNARKR